MARVRGNNRSNVLNDTAGNDMIDGRGGDDTIRHTGGNDTFTGGTGADTFVFQPNGGTVVITDFENGIDRLDVSSMQFDESATSALGYYGTLETHGDDTHVVFLDATGDEALRIVLQDFNHWDIDRTDYIL